MRDIWSRWERVREIGPRAWARVSRAGGVGQDWNPQAHIAFVLGMIIEMQNEMCLHASAQLAGRLSHLDKALQGHGFP